jgi:hypothetical protein
MVAIAQSANRGEGSIVEPPVRLENLRRYPAERRYNAQLHLFGACSSIAIGLGVALDLAHRTSTAEGVRDLQGVGEAGESPTKTVNF